MPVQSIDSAKNTRIKRIRKLLSHPQKGTLFLEGVKLLREAVRSGARIEQVFVTPNLNVTESRLVRDLHQSGVEVFTVSERVMRALSDVESPPGIAAIAKIDIFQEPPMPLKFGTLLVSVRDPGNFGAIIRAAEASGCEFIVYSRDCVHPFNSKVIRASMGSILRVPIVEIADPEQYLKNLEQVRRYALRPREGENLLRMEIVLPALLVIGSESHGLPENIPVDVDVTIPMLGRVESLNTAMAATLCFYWIAHGSHQPPQKTGVP